MVLISVLALVQQGGLKEGDKVILGGYYFCFKVQPHPFGKWPHLGGDVGRQHHAKGQEPRRKKNG